MIQDNIENIESDSTSYEYNADLLLTELNDLIDGIIIHTMVL